MRDIVERLRSECFTNGDTDIRWHASDEIERLREALKGAIAAWDRLYRSIPTGVTPSTAEDDEFGAMQDARRALPGAPREPDTRGEAPPITDRR